MPSTIWNPGSPIVLTGDFLPPITGAYSLGSTTFKWLNLWLSGDANVGGNLVVSGNSTLGDAAGDTVTINPNAVSWPNNPTHSGNHTFTGNVIIRGASNQIGDSTADVVNIAANTIYSDGAGKLGFGNAAPAEQLHATATNDIKFRFESTGGANLVGVSFKNTVRQRTLYLNAIGSLVEFDDTGGVATRAVDIAGNHLFGGMTAGANLAKGIGIGNGTAPTTSPAGGGQLYVEAGALKYRGSAGTVTVLGVA